MEQQENRYTVSAMRDLLKNLESIFEMVRLVDPTEVAVLRLEENGTISKEPFACYQAWSRNARCRNCSGMRGLLGERPSVKFECRRDDLFYIVSRPLILELSQGELQVVLEIANQADSSVIGREENCSMSRQLDEIQEKVYRDPLTHTFNRRYLNEFGFLYHNMDQLCRRLGFIMLDLRQFKLVNDTKGHLAGDQVLMEVARVLQSRVRSQDSIIRMGGDEFLVVLTNCSEEVVSRKTKELGEALLPVAAADFGYSYTEFFRQEKSFLQEMLEIADRRMYMAKRQAKCLQHT